MFSRPKILFLVSLLFVALLNSIPISLLIFIILVHMYMLLMHTVVQEIFLGGKGGILPP